MGRSDVDEAAIPEHLQEGWKAYQDWWMARYRSGNPLPQGGTFILNRRAVLLDELYRFHVEAAQGLGVAFEDIKMELETDSLGRVAPRIDFSPPRGWAAPIARISTSHDPAILDRLQSEYVTGYLKTLYDQMQGRLRTRIASLSQIRPDLQPPLPQNGA